MAGETDDPIWTGPLFKPDDQYLTKQGYPLGTTCWYVRLNAAGRIHIACGDTPIGAIRAAIEWLKAEAETPEFDDPGCWPNLFEARKAGGEG